MLPDIQWSFLLCEVSLIFLALSTLIIDIVAPKQMNHTRIVSNVAMFGLIITLGILISHWNFFGQCFFMSFVHDGFSFFMKAFFLITGIFVLHMAKIYQPALTRGRTEFVLLILFALIGMMFLVSAYDFILLFVALETMTISILVISAYLREEAHSIEAGVKFLILSAMSTAFFLYGLSFIYGATGHTSFIEIQRFLAASEEVSSAFTFGSILILSSIGFKLAIVPFQFWVPDVYEGSPTPLTAFLAIGSKAAAAAILMRLMLTVFVPLQSTLVELFYFLSAVTMCFGNLAAIPQTNIKRLLAYSSIGHAGYILMGFTALLHTGKEAVLFYLITYLFSTAGAFLVVVWVSTKLGSDRIKDYAGLSQRSPLLAAGMFLALSSLAGLPPLAGFFGKFYLFQAAIKADLYALVFVGALNVVFSLYYYLRVIQTIYVDSASEFTPFHIPVQQKIFQYLAIAGIVVLGIFPAPALQFVEKVFVAFFRY